MELSGFVVFILWLALIAYVILGGATFGATIWDLLSIGKQAEQQRRFINQAIGPRWEANHLWLIYLGVALWVAFPQAFSVLSSVLLLPCLLVFAGIILRGVALLNRLPALQRNVSSTALSRALRIASLITPLFLGTIAAVVVSGQVIITEGQIVTANLLTGRVIPYAIAVGAFLLSLCALLAAVHLAVKAEDTGPAGLVEAFRWRALLAGGITAALAASGLILTPSDAPILWNGMFAQAIPLAVVSLVFWGWMMVSLFLRMYRRARVLAGIEAALLLLLWGGSQRPYLVPPSVRVEYAAAPDNVLWGLLISTAIALLLLWLPVRLFRFRSSIFKG